METTKERNMIDVTKCQLCNNPIEEAKAGTHMVCESLEDADKLAHYSCVMEHGTEGWDTAHAWRI